MHRLCALLTLAVCVLTANFTRPSADSDDSRQWLWYSDDGECDDGEHRWTRFGVGPPENSYGVRASHFDATLQSQLDDPCIAGESVDSCEYPSWQYVDEVTKVPSRFGDD